jgi:hypothetical protein
LKNDEDWEDDLFRQYFSPNLAEKININYDNINVNRFLNTNKEYQLRYGEEKLGVYREPQLATKKEFNSRN